MAGIATLWMVLVVILLFAFFALAVDIMFVTVSGRQLSAGADAASLAGVAEVRRSRTEARNQAVALALANDAGNTAIQIDRNDANTSTGDVVIGKYDRDDRSFTPLGPTDGLPNAVKVVAARTDGSLGGPMPTIFGGITTWTASVDVEREAIAMVRGDVGPGVIALDPTARCTMDMRGTAGTFTVLGGVVVVNSNNGSAACHSGQPTMNVDEVYVAGGTDNKFEDQVNLSGDLILDADPIPDPLAALPHPIAPSGAGVDFTNLKKLNNGTHVLLPGLYNNLSISGNANVTLQPGLYYFLGELKVNGGTVDATSGVMLFVAQGGNIDIGGNGTFEIEGMSPTVYPNGPPVPASIANIKVPIFQHRDNTAQMDINGTPGWQMGGTIYVPGGQVSVEGTPGAFANGLIAGSIETRGTAELTIDYDDQFPRIPRNVFIVE